jgi:hypothetical protein
MLAIIFVAITSVRLKENPHFRAKAVNAIPAGRSPLIIKIRLLKTSLESYAFFETLEGRFLTLPKKSDTALGIERTTQPFSL